jgi:hypothetical protein
MNPGPCTGNGGGETSGGHNGIGSGNSNVAIPVTAATLSGSGPGAGNRGDHNGHSGHRVDDSGGSSGGRPRLRQCGNLRNRRGGNPGGSGPGTSNPGVATTATATVAGWVLGAGDPRPSKAGNPGYGDGNTSWSAPGSGNGGGNNGNGNCNGGLDGHGVTLATAWTILSGATARATAIPGTPATATRDQPAMAAGPPAAATAPATSGFTATAVATPWLRTWRRQWRQRK